MPPPSRRRIFPRDVLPSNDLVLEATRACLGCLRSFEPEVVEIGSQYVLTDYCRGCREREQTIPVRFPYYYASGM